MLTIEQVRAARGLLGWSQSDLAKRAGLSLPTVKRVEAGTGPRVSEEARTKLQRTLEFRRGRVHRRERRGTRCPATETATEKGLGAQTRVAGLPGRERLEVGA